MEDEKHFLMYKGVTYLQSSVKKFPNISMLDDNTKFSFLMSQEDPECIKCVSSFIFPAMHEKPKKRIRETLNTSTAEQQPCSFEFVILFLIRL